MDIGPVRSEELHAAVALALAGVPIEERAERILHCVHLLENGTLNARGVRVARDDRGVLVGVQVCVPITGAACLFWLPTQTDALADALVRDGLAWCRSIGCKIAQAFVVPEELPRTQPLLREGFRHVTRMYALQHRLNDLPSIGASVLRYETLRATPNGEFAATLQRTYEGTLDCPELNGVRTVAEIIAGHQAEGRFDPDRWWLARSGTQAVGVVMLTELEDGLMWDLSYMGIVPEFRGQGHGRALLGHALRCARAGLAVRLLVGVDARNLPARRLYASAGFVEDQCHEVLLNLPPMS